MWASSSWSFCRICTPLPSDLIRCGWWGWSPCSGDIRIKSLPGWVLWSLKEYNLNHACPSSQGGNVFFSVFAVFYASNLTSYLFKIC
jgi:hypothetical protein